MGTKTNQNHDIFENIALTFTEYNGQDDWDERTVISKPQKLNRHARAFQRSMKQMGGE